MNSSRRTTSFSINHNQPLKPHGPATYIFPNLYLGDKYNASDLEELERLGVTHIVNCTKDLADAFAGGSSSPASLNQHRRSFGKQPTPHQTPTDSNDLTDGPATEEEEAELGTKQTRRTFTYYRCPLNDSANENLLAQLPSTFEFIDRALSGNYTSATPPSSEKEGSKLTTGTETVVSTSSPRKTRNVVLIHCNAGVSRSPAVCIAYLQYRFGWPLKKAHKFVRQARIATAPNNGFLKALVDYEYKLRGTNSMCLRRQTKYDWALIPLRKTAACQSWNKVDKNEKKI